MSEDLMEQDITAKRHRVASIGGRTAQFIGADYRFTLEEIRDATQKSVEVRQRKREQSALPVGMLRKWHWRAMVVAWNARPQGVKASGGWFGDYGNIAQKVWKGLLSYQDGALVETYETPGKPLTSSGYMPQVYWLRLTAFGEQFYRDNWQRYRELYPEVDAPESGGLNQKTQEQGCELP